jgi:hypothetical protein
MAQSTDQQPKNVLPISSCIIGKPEQGILQVALWYKIYKKSSK